MLLTFLFSGVLWRLWRLLVEAEGGTEYLADNINWLKQACRLQISYQETAPTSQNRDSSECGLSSLNWSMGTHSEWQSQSPPYGPDIKAKNAMKAAPCWLWVLGQNISRHTFKKKVFQMWNHSLELTFLLISIILKEHTEKLYRTNVYLAKIILNF